MNNFLLFFCFLFSMNLYSQNSDTNMINYFNRAKELNLVNNFNVQYLYENKFDIWNIEKYNSAFKTDFLRELKAINGGSIRGATLMSDFIIKGEVIGVNYNKDSNAIYHTIYKIKKYEQLKGNISDTFSIVTPSGFIGENKYTSSPIDPILYIGSNYIFFLHNVKKVYSLSEDIYKDKSYLKFSDSENFSYYYYIRKFYKNNLELKIEIKNLLNTFTNLKLH